MLLRVEYLNSFERTAIVRGGPSSSPLYPTFLCIPCCTIQTFSEFLLSLHPFRFQGDSAKKFLALMIRRAGVWGQKERKNVSLFSHWGWTDWDSNPIMFSYTMYICDNISLILILDNPMCYSNSKNKIIITSNTSTFIVDRSRQHVSTFKRSSSGLLFEISL